MTSTDITIDGLLDEICDVQNQCGYGNAAKGHLSHLDAAPPTIRFAPHPPCADKSPGTFKHTNPKSKFVHTINNNSTNDLETTTAPSSDGNSMATYTSTNISPPPMPYRYSNSALSSSVDDTSFDHFLTTILSNPASSALAPFAIISNHATIGGSTQSILDIDYDDDDNLSTLLPCTRDANPTPMPYANKPSPRTSLQTQSSSVLPSASTHGGRLSPAKASPASAYTATPSTGSAKRFHCARVTTAGPAHGRGLKTSSFSKLVCDRLRCVNCNFRVVHFPGRRWADGADYLFFRNSVPSEDKLAAMLEELEDACAYCCQCTWLSAVEEQAMTTNNGWTCSGHE